MYKVENKKHANPLLNKLIITNEELQFNSIIYPNLGASLQQLSVNGTAIINDITANENGLETYKKMFNSAFLFPFPNRIEKGKYSFNGKNNQLICNDKVLNNAIHGHIYNKSFKVKNIIASKNKTSIVLNYVYKGDIKGFPYPYNLDINYTFQNNKITIQFKVLNSGIDTFPFGIGWHPYFNTKDLSSCILNFNGNQKFFLNESMIPQQKMELPFKTPLILKETFLDDCFIIKDSNTSLVTPNTEIKIYFDTNAENNYLQVYTPDARDSIAIEPMTCAPNCFNNKEGLLQLKPNATFNWTISLQYKLK